jgi:hypothetical protein
MDLWAYLQSQLPTFLLPPHDLTCEACQGKSQDLIDTAEALPAVTTELARLRIAVEEQRKSLRDLTEELEITTDALNRQRIANRDLEIHNRDYRDMIGDLMNRMRIQKECLRCGPCHLGQQVVGLGALDVTFPKKKDRSKETSGRTECMDVEQELGKPSLSGGTLGRTDSGSTGMLRGRPWEAGNAVRLEQWAEDVSNASAETGYELKREDMKSCSDTSSDIEDGYFRGQWPAGEESTFRVPQYGDVYGAIDDFEARRAAKSSVRQLDSHEVWTSGTGGF